MRLLLLILLPFSLIAQSKTEANSGTEKANAFVQCLSDSQRQKAVFTFDEMSRYEWHYLPAAQAMRNGIAIKDMDAKQKECFYQLLQAYLSEQGFTRTKSIMGFEYLLKELEPNSTIRIPENYYVAIYGTPNKDSTWGWKFGGHHIALNFTVVNNRLAFAPFFFGSNPGEIQAGPDKGKRLLKEEEDLGFELVNSLSAEQQKTAVFRLEAFTEIVTTNSKKVNPLDVAGILVKEMTHGQAMVVNKLLVTYLASMPNSVASRRMKKIQAEDMDSIRFGWAGALTPGKAHYYRIQGKTFLIEFDNTQNNANHIHTVWRDFNGDFGEDLLKEHYGNSKHHE